MTQSVSDLVAYAQELATWLDTRIHGLEVPSANRQRLAGASFDIVHEHFKALTVLLERRHLASASALVRPTFETYVRGVWLYRLASEQELQDYVRDKTPGLSKLIPRIEALPSHGAGVLARTRSNYWSAMCSYAHGGYLAAVRRLSNDGIAKQPSKVTRAHTNV